MLEIEGALIAGACIKLLNTAEALDARVGVWSFNVNVSTTGFNTICSSNLELDDCVADASVAFVDDIEFNKASLDRLVCATLRSLESSFDGPMGSMKIGCAIGAVSTSMLPDSGMKEPPAGGVSDC